MISMWVRRAGQPEVIGHRRMVTLRNDRLRGKGGLLFKTSDTPGGPSSSPPRQGRQEGGHATGYQTGPTSISSRIQCQLLLAALGCDLAAVRASAECTGVASRQLFNQSSQRRDGRPLPEPVAGRSLSSRNGSRCGMCPDHEYTYILSPASGIIWPRHLSSISPGQKPFCRVPIGRSATL